MWGYGHDWGMGFGFIFWLVILGVIVAGVVWFVRSQSLAGGQRPFTPHSPDEPLSCCQPWPIQI